MKKLFSALLALLLVCGIVSALPAAAAADPRIEEALEWAVEIAEDDTHGYSRRNRTGPNYDCSSFVSFALMAGGFDLEGPYGTSNIRPALEKLGFTVYRRSEVASLCRGDILLRPGTHVELYLGNGCCVAAHQDYDYRSGDSKGKEIQVRDQQDCPFCRQKQYTYVIRLVLPRGGAEASADDFTVLAQTD